MAATFTKAEYSYRNFNQINYFESKTISNNECICKEIKNDLEQLDKALGE